MLAPAVAVPKTGTVVPRCSTMLEPKIGETLRAAKAGSEAQSASRPAAARRRVKLIIGEVDTVGVVVDQRRAVVTDAVFE